MLIYLWIMPLILFFIPSAHSACVVNDNYRSQYPDMGSTSLCEDADCKKKTSIVASGTKYYKCSIKEPASDTQHSYIVKLINKTEAQKPSFLCDMNGDGTWSSTDCSAKASWTFKPKSGIKDYEIYVLECIPDRGVEPERLELIDNGKPRNQLTGYDFLEASQKVYQQHPIGQIMCINQCTGASNSISATPNSVAQCSKNVCIFRPTADVQSKISCGTLFINIIIVVKFDTRLVANRGLKRKIEKFDAGESISCSAKQQNSTIDKSKRPVQTPAVNLAVFVKDGNKVVFLSEDSKDPTSFTIPNKEVRSMKYFCYFGNRTASDSLLFYKLTTDKMMNVGSPYTTIVQDDKGNKILQDDSAYNIMVGTKIHCDKDSYKTSTSVMISSFYVKSASFPLSDYKTFPEYTVDQSAVKSITISSTPAGKISAQRFINCQVGAYDSVPVRLYAGDRPTVKWVHINPPWKTDYYLGGFVVFCVGRHVNDMTLMCTNCAPKDNLNVKDLDYLEYTQMLEVPTTNRINKNITYKCTGRSNNYEDVVIELNMNIIATQFKELDADVRFRVAGEDYIQCYSSFTVIQEKSVKKKVPLKTFLLFSSGKDVKYENNNSKGIFIPVSSGVSKYQYCCPIFTKNIQNMTKSEFSCPRYRDIDIARDYRVTFSQPLDDLFPGTKLKCYICVNFTTISKNQRCYGKNKIPSLLRMRVVKPNNMINDTGFKEEVETPQEELKPDKRGYYPISDYKVQIACQSKTLNPPLVPVQLKSCNLNPPNIRIHPQDRTMFVVGEIFACTTDSVYCQNGLTYIIYIQRHGEPAEKKDSASFTLLKKHTGNNILIKCAAGETESKVDTRIVRVEIAPYNISINNVRALMMYGQYFRCNSLGFPPPTVTWTQLKGTSKLRISENFMLIGPWDDSGPYAITCEAKNKRGFVSTTAMFEIFNPRIVGSDFSAAFYAVIPITTVIYICLVVGAILVIFQENFFGVPFFSSTAPEAKTKGVSKAGVAKFEEEPLPNLSDVQPKSSIAQTEKSE